MKKRLTALLCVMACVISMAVPALAATDFVPSITVKPAPGIVMQKGSDGKEYAAIIYDANGREVACVSGDNLMQTPVSETNPPNPEIGKQLHEAYDQLKKAGDLTDLSPKLKETIQEAIPGIHMKNLVVRDVFDLTLGGEYAEILKQEGNRVTVRFKLNADAGALAAVLHHVSGDNWETIPNSQIVRNDDQTADVTFTGLSPIVFVYDGDQLNGSSGADTTEPCRPNAGLIILSVVGAFTLVYQASLIICCIVLAICLARKKKHHKA